MRRIFLPGLLGLLCASTSLGAVDRAPATMPSTRPGDDGLPAKLVDAKAAVAAARAAALARCHASEEYRAGAADRAAKLKALETIRREGTPQERLAASSAFVKADQAIKRIEADAVSSDQDLLAAASAEADARARLTEQERRATEQAAAARRAIENDPVHVAIRQHRPILGMTLEQVQQAVSPLKMTRSLETTDNGREVQIWKCRKVFVTMGVDGGGDDAAGQTIVHQVPIVTYGPLQQYEFTDGKLTAITE